MTTESSQQFESYVPVYDVIPQDWENARQIIVEQLKKITNAVNVREIGWFLDEELLSGKQFIPSSINQSGTSQQNRTILRKVVDVAPLAAGAKSVAHGITVDVNFSLIDMWVAATNSTTFTAINLTDTSVTLDATNINITSPGAYDRAWAIVEYIQEQ